MVAAAMKSLPVLFAPLCAGSIALLILSGCSALEVPGSGRSFSNQPNGDPFFRIGSGLGAPTMAVRKPDGKWTKPRAMKSIGPQDPPFNTTPGLAEMVKSAYRVDDYAFLEFKADARDHGQPLPSRYFLYPGGFAYPVPSSTKPKQP